ncbi:MAG: hypothetical protein J5522_04560 [Lachnospiraceae bacterium]|nr:hypothetical protein [Lachnospiraceae bacterium]
MGLADLFKNKYEKKLDEILEEMQMNMSNNYKDNAQKNLEEFESALARFTEQGRIKEKSRTKYENTLTAFKERLKGYSHKDQKPYWSKS